MLSMEEEDLAKACELVTNLYQHPMQQGHVLNNKHSVERHLFAL